MTRQAAFVLAQARRALVAKLAGQTLLIILFYNNATLKVTALLENSRRLRTWDISGNEKKVNSAEI